MRLRAGIAAVGLAAALPAAASAQDDWFVNPYVGLGGGMNWTRDSDVDTTAGSFDVEFDDGWLGAITLGAKVPWFRLEGELAYRDNDIDGTDVGVNAGGDATAWSLMLNALYDIQTGTPFTPYIGVGVGGARVNVDGDIAGVPVIDDHDTVFAYQAIAGVGYQVTENLQLFADYRYFATEDLDLKDNAGGSVDAEYRNHSVLVGLRWMFGAPKPAPAPAPVAQPAPAPAPAAAPAPAPAQVARTYIVFFDWDKADVRPDARRIIETAAANRKQVNVTRIEVTGHADRSGSDRYNERLSMRRAENVRAELIRLGVPENEIAIFAKGEREPLVPTADGVREPQNRRVEIVLK